MTSHLDDGRIQELIDGEIPSADLAPISDHLAACAECRARVATAQSMMAEADALIEALDEPSPAPVRSVVLPLVRPPSRGWIRNTAWAASLVLAVGAGYYARGNPLAPPDDARPEPDAPAMQRAPEVAADPPRVASSAAPTTDGTANSIRGRATAGAVAGGAAGTTTSTADVRVMEDRAERPRDNPARESARPAVAPAVAAASADSSPPPAARPLPGAGVSVEVTDPQMRRAINQVRVPDMLRRDPAETKQALGAASTDTISFTDAVRRMGGRLLLIEGLVPIRLEREGSDVRVIYRVPQGEVILVQSIDRGTVSHRLLVPPEFPAESLAALQRRVKG
jgi:hypothetical protein